MTNPTGTITVTINGQSETWEVDHPGAFDAALNESMDKFTSALCREVPAEPVQSSLSLFGYRIW